MIKNYLKGLLFFFIPLLILLLIINTFYYFDILSNNIMKYLKIVIILFSSFLSGFYIGFKSNNKGYINGLKFSLIIIVIFLLSSLLIKEFNIGNMTAKVLASLIMFMYNYITNKLFVYKERKRHIFKWM